MEPTFKSDGCDWEICLSESFLRVLDGDTAGVREPSLSSQFIKQLREFASGDAQLLAG